MVFGSQSVAIAVTAGIEDTMVKVRVAVVVVVVVGAIVAVISVAVAFWDAAITSVIANQEVQSLFGSYT